jgi:LysR family nitrogen assimilation transcriptional regulator
LDLALVCSTAADARVKTQAVYSDRLVLVGDERCGLSPSRELMMNQLQGVPLVVPSRPNGIREKFEALAAREGVALRISAECNTLPTLLAVAAEGVGYALVPVSALRSMASEGRIDTLSHLLLPASLSKHFVLARLTGGEQLLATNVVHGLVRDELHKMKSRR